MLTEVLAMMREVRDIRRNANLTRAQFEAVKLGKFRRLVRHVQSHAPYYARIIEERRIDVERATPADFPLLTKSLLMANFNDIVTDRRVTRERVAEFLTRSKDPAELFLDTYRVMHTSGTSGEVGYFLYSGRDWARGMAASANAQRTRARRAGFGRARVAFYGATGGHFAGVTMMSAAQRGVARLFVDARAFEINSPLPDVIRQLNEFQPQVLSGYTTALKMLGQKQREGSLRIAPLGIGATGETVTAADITFLREAFGAAVRSAYACTEHLMLGSSEPNETNVTLFDDNLIFEFYDDHSVITNLYNETLPLIRYRMSDILRPLPQHDPTSRKIVVSGLVGRTEMMPTFLNRDGVEDFISPHIINEIFVAGVARFQLHLTGPAQFRFLAMLESRFDATRRARAVAALDARLREILDQKRMGNVTFEIAVVDDIPVDPRTRKFRLVVDKRSVNA